jgi:NAD(P)-dependent dehydrogenase (short-subunit alcohol dehydrogenase family)
MKTMPLLAGKVAVVTGANRAVGADMATLLGEQGATVYVTERTTASKGWDNSRNDHCGRGVHYGGRGDLALLWRAIMRMTHRSRLSSKE